MPLWRSNVSALNYALFATCDKSTMIIALLAVTKLAANARPQRCATMPAYRHFHAHSIALLGRATRGVRPV